jgi:hypothetical protein
MKSHRSRPAARALALACSLLIVACGQGARRPEQPGPIAAALRLYVFDCGTLGADPARFRLTKEEVATTNLAVPCFLIVHPQGTLMWDPGAVPDDEWTPTGAPVSHHLRLCRKITFPFCPPNIGSQRGIVSFEA